MSPDTVYSEVGEMVELSCSTQGGPGNSFTWTFSEDMEQVGNTSDITVGLMDVFDGGVYTCEVQNEAGTGTAASQVFGRL